VSLWPLYFWGVVPWYPGQVHARIMAYGFFGGFILGFLNTAMPRMLSAQSLRLWELSALLGLYVIMVGAYASGHIQTGDLFTVLVLIALLFCLGTRLRKRKDTPPPGFILVALSFLSVIGGAVIALAQEHFEIDLYWSNLQHLLSYQGFVLLPILGIGPFILPRFFGMQSAHDFPEALRPNAAWKKKALFALAAGITILASFFIEANAWYRTGYGLRFAAVVIYALVEMPFRRAPKSTNALGFSIRAAFVCMAGGFFAIALFPAYRVSLLHLTLIGGFAVITFIVATRVVFGHSGNIQRLKARNRWLGLSVGLMLFAMATRVSGDFWPKIMASHYTYGAIVWIISVAIWAAYVLPKVLVAEQE
jgi:uncharacterized protein involved in response to NO